MATVTGFPGSDPRVPVSAPPLQVYFPAAYGHPTVSITNIGGANIYLNTTGSGAAGFLLQPNEQFVSSHAVFPIYAVAASVTLGTAITTSTAYSAGGTSFVLSGSGTAFGTGSTVALGGSTTTEYLTVSTINGATVTTTSASVYDHASGVSMALVSAVQGSSVHVQNYTG
jgi:hypothetical protein